METRMAEVKPELAPACSFRLSHSPCIRPMFLIHNRLSPPVEELLAKGVAGEALSREEASRLMRASGSEVPALMMAAGLVRDRSHPGVVTYSRKVFIPLTNLCRDVCGYCTFVKQPGTEEAQTMTPERCSASAKAAKRAGCKEALFSLGDKPELKYPSHREWLRKRGYATTLAYLREMCELVYRETGLLPHVNPGIMTRRRRSSSLREVSASDGHHARDGERAPAQEGRGALPLPRQGPERAPARRSRRPGELKVAFTTGILIGIGETLEERVDSLFAIKELHERYGHIQEVIVQNFRAKPDIAMADHPTSRALLDMLRTIAVARLVLGGEMNIQAPPNLTPDAYQHVPASPASTTGAASRPSRATTSTPRSPWPKIVELRETTRRRRLRAARAPRDLPRVRARSATASSRRRSATASTSWPTKTAS